jgi:hypothetical protein
VPDGAGGAREREVMVIAMKLGISGVVVSVAMLAFMKLFLDDVDSDWLVVTAALSILALIASVVTLIVLFLLFVWSVK